MWGKKNRERREKEVKKQAEEGWSDPGYEYGPIRGFPAVDDSAFERLFEWEQYDDPEYTTSTYGNLILSRKRLGNSWTGRAILNVDVTARQMLDTFWQLASRHEWDPLFSFMKEVKSLDEGTQLVHIASKKLPLVSRRDFIQRRKRLDVDTGDEVHAAVFLPADTTLLPPMPASTRGEIHFSGMVCRPNHENGCKLVMMTDTSFGMPIPTWIMNQLIPVFAKLYLSRLTRHLALVIKGMEEKALQDREAEEQENPGSTASDVSERHAER